MTHRKETAAAQIFFFFCLSLVWKCPIFFYPSRERTSNSTTIDTVKRNKKESIAQTRFTMWSRQLPTNYWNRSGSCTDVRCIMVYGQCREHGSFVVWACFCYLSIHFFRYFSLVQASGCTNIHIDATELLRRVCATSMYWIIYYHCILAMYKQRTLAGWLALQCMVGHGA